jgi:hypothetical protein
MKIKTKELTDASHFLGHIIIDCLNTEAGNIIHDNRGKKTEWDIKLVFEGVELDIRKFTKHLEKDYYHEVERAEKKEAQKLFEKWKQDYKSKNYTNAQLAEIKIQLDKANNQIKNISENIVAIH